MSYYQITATKGIRSLATVYPETEKEQTFNALWQQKKYADALKHFPDKWVWFSEDITKELVTDMPGNAFAGIIFSKRSFDILYPKFQEDMLFYHDFNIDNYHFVWVHIPIINQNDVENTKHEIFKVGPLYKTYASELFYDFFKKHGFTGQAFTLAKYD